MNKFFKEEKCEKVSKNNEDRQALLSSKHRKTAVHGAGFGVGRSVGKDQVSRGHMPAHSQQAKTARHCGKETDCSLKDEGRWDS